MTPALEVQSLLKKYGRRTAVSGLDLRIDPGELCCLLGPNGAGKSTLLRIVTGQQPCDAGVVRATGIDPLAQPEEVKRRVGFVPQEAPLFDHLSPGEMIELAGRLRGLDRQRAVDHAHGWLERVGPRNTEGHVNAQLSGGQRQMVALGCALAGTPGLLVLDEAYAGLDAAVMRRVDQALREYVATGGAILMTSHQLDHVERVAARVVIMRRGGVVAQFSRAELAQHIPSRHASLTELYLECVGDSDADAEASTA